MVNITETLDPFSVSHLLLNLLSQKTLNISHTNTASSAAYTMVVHWRRVLRLLPLIVIAALVVFEDRVSIPSCVVVPNGEQHVEEDHPDDLKVMMVANLLLLGSEAGYNNIFFSDYYLSKFFEKSFKILKPDMLLVLGDVSARGSKLTRSKWSSVINQFHKLLGPFHGCPFHVILGDRDIGDCSELNAISVNWLAGNFPGLDSSGCGAFEISNISFVSLNAVAFLCGNNKLRFSVEKVIERESIDLRMDSEQTTKVLDESTEFRLASGDFGWRENAMSSGSGPVLLLHFPLHWTENNNYWDSSAFGGPYNHPDESSKIIENRGFVGTGPYDLLHTLPPNATEYIFQALKPRIVFSAHTHKFCDRTHSDGTREITVPAMTWDARSEPGFVVASFKRNGGVVIVSHCSLARESNVLIAYISIVILFISTMLVAKSSHLTSSGS
ncbi:Metallophosphoesterase 1 [Camellia lanceoleosa]|uniref:Metallophosphoesterase 1 n=1 Tax=Camellia lanceoleosa TaxID=1840588 RepID=A0ACC0HM21_9ERIC|nr:Metallophosphoesterase 1 [Camellia lanceoleosa]